MCVLYPPPASMTFWGKMIDRRQSGGDSHAPGEAAAGFCLIIRPQATCKVDFPFRRQHPTHRLECLDCPLDWHPVLELRCAQNPISCFLFSYFLLTTTRCPTHDPSSPPHLKGQICPQAMLPTPPQHLCFGSKHLFRVSPSPPSLRLPPSTLKQFALS